MQPATDVLPAGFVDPVRESQTAFRTAMNALARPGMSLPLASPLAPPPPLTPAAAALSLALMDFEVAFHIAPSLRQRDDAARYLRFHTDAMEVADPARAAFALLDLAQDPLILAQFAPGEADYPDRSTTILALVASLTEGMPLVFSGPGIAGEACVSLPLLPADFVRQWAANRAGFPLGVDMLFVAPDAVMGLPRSTTIKEGR